MSNIKFGAIIPPASSRHGAKNVEALLANIKLLDMLEYDVVWFLANASKSGGISALKSAISSINRTTTEISVGLALNPDDFSDSVAKTMKRVDKFDFRSAISIAIAAQVSPASAQLASANNVGLVSVGATAPGGFNALASHWEIYSRKLLKNDHLALRSNWSIAAPMHLAETRELAMEQVLHGIDRWLQPNSALGLCADSLTGVELAKTLIENGFAVIGTPADAISQIERLVDQTGGFGTCLLPVHNWANSANTARCYEIFAEHVAPSFKSASTPNE